MSSTPSRMRLTLPNYRQLSVHADPLAQARCDLAGIRRRDRSVRSSCQARAGNPLTHQMSIASRTNLTHRSDVQNVTESVIQRLQDVILGELEPGAELASESDLATQLGVSRLTLREATKTLQARGLVEVRQGRRPLVAYPSARPMGEFFTAAVRRDPRRLLDLLEVRGAVGGPLPSPPPPHFH